MGYVGMNHWQESDNSSAFMDDILHKMTQHLAIKDNQWNTPGCVDVALVMLGLTLDHNESNKFNTVRDFHRRVLIALENSYDKGMLDFDPKNEHNCNWKTEMSWLIKNYKETFDAIGNWGKDKYEAL